MNIIQIVEKYLKDNNYDGLYNIDIECACFNNDLFPCGGEDVLECKAGYKCKIKFDGKMIDGIREKK